MSNCTQCGSSIPEGQIVCSMCYGDPYYGSDGYYLQYLQQLEEEQQRKQEEQRREQEYES